MMRNKLPLPDPSLHLHSVQCSVTTHCPQQSPPSKLCNAIFRASLQNPSPANILSREFTDFLSYLYYSNLFFITLKELILSITSLIVYMGEGSWDEFYIKGTSEHIESISKLALSPEVSA